MVLRETGDILLVIRQCAHAHKRWPASCKREFIPTKYLHSTAKSYLKYSAGKVLERPRVNAALVFQRNKIYLDV